MSLSIHPVYVKTIYDLTISAEIEMTDDAIQKYHGYYYNNPRPNCEKYFSIRQNPSNFIEGQIRAFSARLSEVQRVIKQLTALYESISDLEICDTMDVEKSYETLTKP